MNIFNPLGFRIKVELTSTNIDFSKIRNTFKQYFESFEILELKSSLELINNEYFEKVVTICQEINETGLSLHLPPNILEESISCIETNHIIDKLNKINFTPNTRLITHFPEKINNENIIKKIEKMNNDLPKSTLLLLENIDNYSDSIELLEYMNNFFSELDLKENNKCFLCLDFGHLFFNSLKNELDFDILLRKIEQMPILIRNIKEIHIHDFDNNTDHLPLGTGQFPLKKVISFLAKNDITAPIILEVNLNDLFKDGNEQINIIKKCSNEN